MKTLDFKSIETQLDIYMKVLSFAHINFSLQTSIKNRSVKFDDTLNINLKKINYTGKCIKELDKDEFNKLFMSNGFFGYTDTGNRLVSYALHLISIDKDLFHKVEEALENAYHDTKQTCEKTYLLDKTYMYTLDTLSIFKS